MSRKQTPFVLESTLPLEHRGDILHESFLDGLEPVERPCITWPIAPSKGATSTLALLGLILIIVLLVLGGVWLHRFALPAGRLLGLVLLLVVLGLVLLDLVLLDLALLDLVLLDLVLLLLRCLGLRRSFRPATALGLGFRLGLGLALGFRLWVGLSLGFRGVIFTLLLLPLVVLSFIILFISSLFAEVSIELFPALDDGRLEGEAFESTTTSYQTITFGKGN